MDLHTVASYRVARARDELRLAPGEALLGGGTWLFSEPQPHLTGLVDLTGMGWPDLEVSESGLRIAATCTIERLVDFAEGRAADAPHVPVAWTALSIVRDAANALLASFKIWHTATVGGNVCRSYASASMVSLAVALDADTWIWQVDGGDRRVPVSSLMTGDATNNLAPGEVLRAIELPAHALRSTAVLRRIALAELGRSGAVVTGRVDEDGSTVITVTAATLTPTVLRWASIPTAAALAEAVGSAPSYYDDPQGPADWRRAVSIALAEDVRAELEGGVAA